MYLFLAAMRRQSKVHYLNEPMDLGCKAPTSTWTPLQKITIVKCVFRVSVVSPRTLRVFIMRLESDEASRIAVAL